MVKDSTNNETMIKEVEPLLKISDDPWYITTLFIVCIGVLLTFAFLKWGIPFIKYFVEKLEKKGDDHNDYIKDDIKKRLDSIDDKIDDIKNNLK